MSSNEMTAVERIVFLERAVEELRLELAKVEANLVEGPSSGPRFAPTRTTLQDHHEGLEALLIEQYSTLSRILADALAEMNRLKREPPL